MQQVPHGLPLGGRSASAFLRRYWQKDALLVRRAVAGFEGVLSTRELFRLAGRDDVESRLVVRERRSWMLEHGPFTSSRLKALPPRNWTLLVQGVNLQVAAADRLLRRFSFIPYARLDDVMVSHATPGGGVGPHYDSYDVFLLQGQGRRRWQYGRQQDLTLRPKLSLKILARFEPSHDEVLRAGDMLYLPPSHAHDGVALDECTTYSIGFRSPTAHELAVSFLDWMRDRVEIEGRYSDPALGSSAEPARIPASMQAHAARTLAKLRWRSADVELFMGAHLTEPAAQVFFQPPSPLLTLAQFTGAAMRRGVELDAGTRLLYDDAQLYLNGSPLATSKGRKILQQLANKRALDPDSVPDAPLALLYDWYCHGFIHLA